MEGKKIELARLAAIGVVDNLRPIDMVGVLIFDNSFQWAVPIRKADDPGNDQAPHFRNRAGWRHSDRTRTEEAYRRVLPSRATFKHIVLLDRWHLRGGRQSRLIQGGGRQHVTISTVGFGQDVNRAYFEKIASSRREILLPQ